MNNKKINSENKDTGFLKELSFFDKVKHSLGNLKAKSQEQKVALERELAQKQLDKTKKELEKVLELEKATQEKLQKEKEELQRKKEEALLRAKKIEEEKAKLEEEERKLALLREEQMKKEEEEKRKAELEKIKAEEEKEIKEKEEKLRLELEKEKKEEDRRLQEEQIEKEKREKEEKERQEKEEKEKQRKLVNEQLAKEHEDKLKKIEEDKKETLRLKKEREELLAQMKEVSKTTEIEKTETRKIKLEQANTEKELLDSEEILYQKEAQIEEERLRLVALNKLNVDDKTKQSISKKEEQLRKLLAERKEIKKQILLRKKQIDKDNKTFIREEKITNLLTDLKNIKQNVNNEVNKNGESLFSIKEDNEERNIFTTTFHTIAYYISKYIFRKDIDKYSYVRKTRNHIKLKIFISLTITIVIILFLILFMKLFATNKESYGEFYTTTTTSNTTASNSNNTAGVTTTQATTTANNSIVEIANKEEQEAKNSYNYPSISFPVNREIKTLEKLSLYKSVSWNDKGDSIESGTTLKVNLLTSPGGYMMYQISEGNNAGKFISANPKLVEVITNIDSSNLDFINYPLAITILKDQDTYSNKELTSTKNKVSSNTTLNVKGYGISNNRLIYHLEDDSFIPFNANVQQTQRR